MKLYCTNFLAVFVVVLTAGCNPTILTPSPTLPATAVITDIPLPVPTNTSTTIETISPLTVDYQVTYRCNDGKAIYNIVFRPDGGKPDYTFSPSETFIAKPGESKEALVTSADGQVWQDYVVIIPNDCKKPSDENSISPGANTDNPATVIPECEPLGNSGKCKKK
jgi:hypothetical protein